MSWTAWAEKKNISDAIRTHVKPFPEQLDPRQNYVQNSQTQVRTISKKVEDPVSTISRTVRTKWAQVSEQLELS